MANQIVSIHAGIYGMGIYAIMLPSTGFSVAHSTTCKGMAIKPTVILQRCVDKGWHSC